MILPCQYDPAPFDAVLDTKHGSRNRRAAVTEAKALCAECPIREKCKADNPEHPGVVGGLSWADRHPGQRETDHQLRRSAGATC